MKFKKLSILLLTVLSVNSFMACSLPFAHVTGDQIVTGKSQNLVVQSSIKMEESNVNSLTGGQISEVLVSEGDTVTKGQPLVAIDCDSILAQKAQAEAGVGQAKAGLEQAQAAVGQAQAGKALAEAKLQEARNGATEEELNQLRSAIDIAKANIENAQAAYDVSKSNYDRTKALYDAGAATKAELEGKESALQNAQTSLDNAKSNLDINNEKYNSAVKGATAEQIAQAQAGVDQAQSGIEQAQAGVEKAQSAVDQAQAAVDQINYTLEKCCLVSPVDGVVTTVNVKNGDLVSSGMPSVVVTDTYNPSMTCNIRETDLDKVELGQEVTIKIPAYDGKEFKGKVTNINSNADFATKKATNDNGDFDILSYGVKVEFEDLEGLKEDGIDLRANMTTFVDFGK